MLALPLVGHAAPTYTSTANVPYQWINPSTGAVILSGNAAAAGTINLDTPWGGIYGEEVSQLRVSRNGFLSSLITDPGGDETNDCPLPAIPSQGGGFRLYVLHDNLEIDNTNGRIRYQYFPESPHPLYDCGVHVITWENVHHSSPDTTRFSFQALLFDNLDILYQYGDGNPEGGSGSTTGIQDSSAEAGLTVVCDTPNSIKGSVAFLIQPETIVVNTLEDELDTPAGANVSLREALRDIVSGGRIEFDASLSRQTIQLAAAEGGQGSGFTLTNKVVAVDAGSLADRVYVSGGDATKLFTVNSGSWLSLKKLHLERGTSQSIEVNVNSALIASDVTVMSCGGSSLGPVVLTNSSAAAFYDCRFVGNSGFNSGAVLANGGSLLAEKCKFWRNKSTLNGGAIGLLNADAKLRFCDFALNTASWGGGLSMRRNVQLDAFGCTFDSNHAEIDGGGIFMDPSNSATAHSAAVLKYCTFFQNSSHDDGGAIFEQTTGTFGVDLDVYQSTFYQNHARGEGGAFYLDESKVDVSGTIMADNTADGIGEQVGQDPAGSGGLNPLAGNVETGVEGKFSLFGGQSNVADINLTDLGHFGGCVRVCMPLQASPAIDASTLASFVGPTDARGFSPARDGGAPTAGADLPDAGAVELGPTTTVKTASASALQQAVNAVADGGVVDFASGVKLIALSSDLAVPSGRTVFIDASANKEVVLERLGFSLTGNQDLALHGIRATGDEGVTMIVEGGQLTTSRSHFSGYTLTTPALFELENASASFLRTHLTDNFFVRNIIEGVIYAGESRTELCVRDCFLQNNRPKSAPVGRASVLGLKGGLGILERNSFVKNDVFQGASPSGVLVVRPGSTTIRAWAFLGNNTIADNTIRRLGSGSSSTGALVVVAGGIGGISQLACFAESVHNTIVDNELQSTSAGGGIRVSASSSAFMKLIVRGTIVSGHGSNNVVGSADVISGGGNLSDTAPSFFGASDVPNTDPLLSPLVMGPNRTLHRVPRPGSPCIDAIASVSPARISDGRGFQRLFDGDGNGTAQLDIGAVESGRVLMVTTAADENNGSLGAGTGDSLRECVSQGANLGAVNIGFNPSLANMTLPRGSGTMIMTSGLVDIDGLDTGITVQKSTGGALFSAQGDATLTLTGLTIDALWSSVVSTGQSTVSLYGCQLTGLGQTVGAAVLGEGMLHMKNCQITGNSVSGSVLSTADEGVLLLENSAIYDNEGTVSGARLIDADDCARVSVRESTLARNGFEAMIDGANQTFTTLRRSTITRNGGGITLANTARIHLDGLVVANNRSVPFFSGTASGAKSHGMNLVDHADPRFDHSSDLKNRGGYLCPLIDADGDGIPEMPLLAASARFNQSVGSMDAPSEVLMVTTAADENDSPAGVSVSLREAIRDAADGGTIVFAPGLNNALFSMLGSPIELPRSLTIDATSLPRGIDIRARFFSNVAGNRIRMHGVHLRDNTVNGANGGALGMSSNKGALAMSHCAISNINIGTNVNSTGAGISMSNGVQFALENCTFSNNRAGKGSALYLTTGTTGRVEFCTFAEGRAAEAAIVVGFSASLDVYASTFFDNFLHDGTTESAAIIGNGTLTSLGYNLFSTASAPLAAVSTDDVFANPGASYSDPFEDFYGGWVDVYHAIPVSGLENRTPVLVAGDVRPPEHDSRGYARIFGSSADYGALEFGGSIADDDGDGLPSWWERLYGFNPNAPEDLSQDNDGDERDLRNEYSWRTDPFDAASYFDISHVSTSSSMTLMWNSQPGYDYRIDTCDDMKSWSTDGPVIRATAATSEFKDTPIPNGTDRRFYRVQRLGGLGWIESP